MLLTRGFLMISLAVVHSPSLAVGSKTPIQPEPGRYTRVKGPEKFCSDFTLKSGDLKRGKLVIDARNEFSLRDSKSTIKSDLDPACEFRAEATTKTVGDETVLIKTDAEVCENRVKSEEIQRLVIRPGVIQLESKVTSQGITSVETCEWSLRKN
jgi:hypothetical protein